jgi:hypothetical protein
MSSAVTDSICWFDSRFRTRASASDARKPVTTTSSNEVVAGGASARACEIAAIARHEDIATLNVDRRRP